ncbi:MAG: hypothetical protein BroJett040_22880 [Oligoflexia bacterium]|nr:MAG: hypothetical protein BroJett040_22880 [Oligoflexia bacterium]
MGISACTINGNIDSSFSSINPKLPDQNTIIVGRDYTIELPNSYCPCTLTSQSSNLTANNSNHSISATSAGVVRFDVTDGTGLSKSFELTAVDVLGTGVPALTRVEQAGTYQITLTQAGLGGLGPFEVSIYSGGGGVSATGLFTAPSSSGSTVILIRDSLGQTYNMNFDIYPTFNIGSTAPAITTGNTTTISGSGAYGGYTYTLVSGPGSVNATTGVYTPAGPGVAVIRVTDAQGISRETTLTITDVLAISPSSKTVAVNNSVSFSASGGVAPLVYSIVSGGGSINSSTGVFTAPAGSGSVTVRVTDAINNTSDAVMTVNPALQISPASITLAVNNSTTFTATGGVGTYTYSIQSGGGSINSATGAFIAPASSGSVTVQVADTLGNTSDAVVTVNPALQISPASIALAVNNIHTFTASGGVGTYTYSIQSGGGTINSATGVFTAPAGAGSVTVRVTDALNNTSDAVVTVNPALQISPTAKTLAVNNIHTFTASGGVGTYVYSASAGNINSATGEFTAPATSGSVSVTVTDSLSNTSQATVTVNPALSITPTTVTLATGNTQSFAGVNGVSPYQFSMLSGTGSIHLTSGLYAAPPTTGTEIVRITDSLFNTSDATITVVPQPSLSINYSTIALNNTATVTASNGVPPYTYSIQSGGGSINGSTGVYTPASTGAKVLKVTDSKANTATVNLTVNAALAISPASPTLQINAGQTFTASGGVGSYTYSIASGGGTINSSSGAYTAPGTTGSATVRVTDALGNTSNASITIIDTIYVTISSHVQNFNLRNVLMAAPYNWNGTTPISVQVTVNAGVYVWSDSTAIAAFDTGSFPAGSNLTLINNGYIMGRGGNGGNSPGGAGGAGGNALNILAPITCSTSTGYILGGGGGGAASEGGAGGGGAGGGMGGTSNTSGGSGGSIGNVGSNGVLGLNTTAGGGGGRVVLGSGGAQSYVYANVIYNAVYIVGNGGGAGGGGGTWAVGTASEPSQGWGGAGGSTSSGSNGAVSATVATFPSGGNAVAGGGGGGWGAAGGYGYSYGNAWTSGLYNYNSGAGGKAINTNGNTVTWSGGSQPATVYGAVN